MPVRTAITTSRRQTVGLALLSMVGLREAATAEGKNKKKSKNRKKDDKCDRKADRAVAEACGRQIDFCLANASSLCERATNVPACLTAVAQCCDFFGQCDPDGYFTCIHEHFPPPEEV